MSIQVNTIDKTKVKQDLKKSPKSVQDYVKALENVYEMNKRNLQLAINKLKQS